MSRYIAKTVYLEKPKTVIIWNRGSTIKQRLRKTSYLSNMRPMARLCQGADWESNKGMKWQVLGNHELG